MKKKPSVMTNFHFLVNFIRHTGPMVTMVTRYTGSLSQLPVVKMSWGTKSKKKSAKVSGIKSAGAAKGAKEAKV